MERSYVVPLRREWLKVPAYKRSKKAITALKQFLTKHMKSEDISITTEVNEAIWYRGIKRPPHKLKIKAKKEDDKVICQLQDKPFPAKVEAKEEAGAMAKTLEKLTGKKVQPVKEVKKEESNPEVNTNTPKTDDKPVKKEEIKTETPKAEVKPKEEVKEEKLTPEKKSE